MSILEGINTAIMKQTINADRQARFLEIWCNWLARGYSAAQAAEGLMEVYGKQPEGAIARSTYQALSEGLPVSEGLKGWFPPALVHAISLYESSGHLVERRAELVARIRSGSSAMSTFLSKVGYGLVLLGIVVIMYIAIVHNSLVPAIRSIVPEEKWGDDIKLLANISSFLAYYWWSILLGTGATILFFATILPRWTGNLRILADKLPAMHWYCTRKGCQLLQSISLLVQAGDSWRAAAQRSIEADTPYGRFYTSRFLNQLSTGAAVGEALASMGCLDKSISYQLQLLQDELDLPVMAEQISKEFEEDSLKTLGLTAQSIQMFLFAVTGASIIMVFSGSYGILNSVSSGL
ncbi:MAG: hypothetical protein ACR2PW_07595 [Gammaproteobacteria bacterium]